MKPIAGRHLTALLACIALLGCGENLPPMAPVHGKVTYKGQPVINGSITFVPDAGGPTATGMIQPDGSYELFVDGRARGAVLGTHTIMVISLEETEGKLPEQRNPLPAMKLPEKYSNNKRSGLTATVRGGENVIDIPLE